MKFTGMLHKDIAIDYCKIRRFDVRKSDFRTRCIRATSENYQFPYCTHF